MTDKFRYGIADNLLTTFLASALGRQERGQNRILVTPTMHGSMHNALLSESLTHLQSLGVTVIPPTQAEGKNLLPDLEEIAMSTARALSRSSLRGQALLITGGPTPIPLDGICRLTNHFTGQLGLEIAKALWLCDADVHLILGQSGLIPPPWLPHQIAQSRLRQGHAAVVANRTEEQKEDQIAWLVSPDQSEQKLKGKAAIGLALCAWLESHLSQ